MVPERRGLRKELCRFCFFRSLFVFWFSRVSNRVSLRVFDPRNRFLLLSKKLKRKGRAGQTGGGGRVRGIVHGREREINTSFSHNSYVLSMAPKKDDDQAQAPASADPATAQRLFASMASTTGSGKPCSKGKERLKRVVEEGAIEAMASSILERFLTAEHPRPSSFFFLFS